ncbi:MAG: phage tail sheath C-terminal domain-containing protein [Candidatus Accumulibacter sp. UW26]|jgi:hypothetical protein
MPRQAGIHLVDLPSPLADGLPAMDVPVFVGFAERGPLDRPVALEDPAQYAAVFGGVLELVPTGARGPGEPRQQRAHLPAAVASFFAGGGRRCYVIRVADRQQARAARFAVAGLRLAIFDRDQRPPAWRVSANDFELAAASPGAWADRHELAVRQRSVAVHADDALRRGELLRLRPFGKPFPVGWLRVERPATVAETLLAVPPSNWLWWAAPEDPTDISSPPPPGLASPPEAIDAEHWQVERMTVDLALRHPQHGEIRRLACALAAGGDQLPWFEADAEGLFDAGEALPAAAWPLAGPSAARLASLAEPVQTTGLDPAAADWLLLPLAVTDSFGPWRAAILDHADALTRNGLADYSPRMFTDPAWNLGLRGSELRRWADDLRFFGAAPRRLRGLHGALGRDDAVARDATWIAVPDATHPGWTRDPAPASPAGRLQATPDESCSAPPTPFATCQPPPPRIPAAPRFDFSALRASGEKGLAVIAADLAWQLLAAADDSPPGESRTAFEVEIARLADFSDAWPLPVERGERDLGPPWPPGPGQEAAAQPRVLAAARFFAPVAYRLTPVAGLYFLRARSWRAGRYSAWSASVELLARAGGWRLRGNRDDDLDPVVEPVHRALLDLCAASREHFALLAVPERWPAARIARHTAALAKAAASQLEAAQATSFVALHHPWLLRRESADESAGAAGDNALLHAHPPEGALLGSFARHSRQRGAWAPASLDALAEAVALAAPTDAAALAAAGANPLERRAHGIAASRAATLSDDADWQAIGVRRLFILLRRLARREGERYLFEPNDLTLRRSLERSFTALLQRLLQSGALRGANAAEAYALQTASGVRAGEEIERGECSLEIRVAPSYPLRFLTLRVVRSGERLLVEEG